jgi:predicted MFS family arabinose efflux permease
MVPSLFLSNLTVLIPSLITSLFLVDIARSFEVPVGVAAQIITAFYAVAVIVALLTSVLSFRFGHKQLIIIGLFLVSVSAFGCYFTKDLTIMLFVYSMSGFGLAIVQPMSGAMIGEYLPVEKRGTAMGWIVAGMASAFLVGSPVASFLCDWHLTFLAFVLPISLLSLFFTIIVLPSHQNIGQVSGRVRNYLQGLREIIGNRSALACLLGNLLCSASWMAILTYFVSFFRQRFLVPTSFASIMLIVGSLTYISGSLVGGRFINRFGRKFLTIPAVLVLGMCVIIFMFVPNLWLSLALSYLGCFASGMRLTAGSSLALEQVPEFRASMMSINSAAINMGSVIGNSFGGLVILLFSYEAMGLLLGAMGIVGFGVFLFLTIDPTRRAIAQTKSER